VAHVQIIRIQTLVIAEPRNAFCCFITLPTKRQNLNEVFWCHLSNTHIRSEDCLSILLSQLRIFLKKKIFLWSLLLLMTVFPCLVT